MTRMCLRIAIGTLFGLLASCGGGGGEGDGGGVDAVEIQNETGWDVRVDFQPQSHGAGAPFSVEVPFNGSHLVPASRMNPGVWIWRAYTSGINQFPNPCGANNCEIDGFGEHIFLFADRIIPHFVLVDGQ